MTIADLRPTDEVHELRARYRSFMDEHVYPNEAVLGREDDESDAAIARLRALAKDEGLWAPHLPRFSRAQKSVRARIREAAALSLGSGS